MTLHLLDALRRLELVAADLRDESASLREARDRLIAQSADYRMKAAERELLDPSLLGITVAPWTPAGQE